MWDFSFELPALLLIGIILTAYFSTKHLPTRQNHFYLAMTSVFILTGAMNVLSGWMDLRFSSVWTGPGRIVLDTINTAFYILLFARTMSLVYYYMIAIGLAEDRAFRHLYGALSFAGGIFIALFSFSGYFHTYTAAGYQIAAGYRIFAFIQLAVCGILLLLLFLFRCELPGTLRRCLYSADVILFISAVFDLFLPYILISDMLMALILLMLYLFFMNPGYYISGRTDTFNLEGLKVILRHYDPSEYRIIGLTLKNYMTLREIFYPSAVSNSLIQIGSHLNMIAGSIVFYVREGNFVLFLKKDVDADKVMASLQSRFKQAWQVGQTQIFYDTGYIMVDTDQVPRDGDSFLVLIRHGMKAAEKDGIVRIGEDMIREIERHEAVHHVLDRCVRSNTVEVYLQPLFDARDGRLVGAEALARLTDPEMGFISPGEFIPIAEDTGIITELGRQVFRKTCLFLRNHEIPGLQWVNVNVSPAQFVNIHLSDEYSSIAHEAGVDTKQLHLEITEAAYVSEYFLHQRMDAFISQGFHMVLDDFGSGYSNLNRVMDYPFSNIKLDMAFVKTGLAKHGSMLGDIIHAFHDMGFSVTAEGIETEDMAASMREYGCDFFQGFLYSRPLQMDAFARQFSSVPDFSPLR